MLYRIVWSFHHIILDGWPFQIVLKDFWSYYRNLDTKREVSCSFKQYIDWVNQQNREEALQYWKEELQGFNQVYSLCLPHKKLLGNEYLSKEYHMRLSKDETNVLDELCRRLDISLNAFITTIWGMLLCRYSNQADVIFGSVVSGRPATLYNASDIVGLMINTNPVRVSFDDDVIFCDLVKQTQIRLYQSEPYSYMDLASIQSHCHFTLDHVIVFENYPSLERNALTNEMKIKHMSSIEQINYPFCMEIIPSESLLFHIMYNQNYYEDETIHTLMQHLKCLL